ncbi:MAG: hypothetical protein EBY81_03105 [Verrucomicrobia bacterium]|nr:hypothetical protein [Verrucomicrobiota bacterium]
MSTYQFVRPHWIGKVATFLQISVVLLGLLLPGSPSTKPVLWLAGMVTLASLAVYVARGWHLLHTSYGESHGN